MTRDFYGFSYNGIHSSDLNVVRVSDGSRYEESLIPNFSNKTASIAGSNQTYFYGREFQNKTFALQLAFDSVTEENFRAIRNWFNTDKPQKLIFDEEPYKYYMAAVDQTPVIQYICFDDPQGQRVYKGEITVNLICYYPFARSVWKWDEEFGKFEEQGEFTIFAQDAQEGQPGWKLNTAAGLWQYSFEDTIPLPSHDYGQYTFYTTEESQAIIDKWSVIAVNRNGTVNIIAIESEDKNTEDLIIKWSYKAIPQVNIPQRPLFHVGAFPERPSNWQEWYPSSGIVDIGDYNQWVIENYELKIHYYNGGDIETPFKIYLKFANYANDRWSIAGFTLINGELSNEKGVIRFINIDAQIINEQRDYGICINMKNHLVEGIDESGHLTGTVYNQYIATGDFFNLSKGEGVLNVPGAIIGSVLYEDSIIYKDHNGLEYDYLYL